MLHAFVSFDKPILLPVIVQSGVSSSPGDLKCLENISDLIWQVPMVSGRVGVGALKQKLPRNLCEYLLEY